LRFAAAAAAAVGLAALMGATAFSFAMVSGDAVCDANFEYQLEVREVKN
jgi:hypothetical protein